MPGVTHSASMKPPFPVGTPSPGFSASATSTTLPPLEEMHMQVHTVLIVTIFCIVCLLLLLAFIYAFCLHCSIDSSPKDLPMTLEREDTTYRCTSSENHSVRNMV